MKRWDRWSFNLFAVTVALTGLVYFWMKYFVVNDDPFAVVNHSWQPAMLALHVVASPGLILMFGIILNSHILKKLGARGVPNRFSGLMSLSTFFFMIASGYLLQVATGEQVLRALVVVHVASGGAFTVVYTAHLVVSARLARAAAGRRIQSEAA